MPTTRSFRANLLLLALGLTAPGLVMCTPATTPPTGVVHTSEQNFRVTAIVAGLEHPWSVAFLPDGRMLVTERPGRLRIVQDGKLLPQPVQGLPAIAAEGQGGLLDVALHSHYAENGWIYLSYAAAGSGGLGTEVLRARLRDGRLEQPQVIFRAEPKRRGGRHFGSRLLFDREGRLYVTLGERGDQDHAQRLDDHLGTVIRLYDDGRVPADNPFVGRPGAKAEIYSYGHRNVQGAALHPTTGLVWTHEFGPQGGDEVNVLRPGANYGWPVITYGVEYVIGTKIGEGTHKEGMVQPIYRWVPSISPSGMAFYTGDKFPSWRGDLFIGGLGSEQLIRLRLDGENVTAEERMLQGVGRVRDVRAGPDGHLYLLIDAPDGALLRLDPAAK